MQVTPECDDQRVELEAWCTAVSNTATPSTAGDCAGLPIQTAQRVAVPWLTVFLLQPTRVAHLRLVLVVGGEIACAQSPGNVSSMVADLEVVGAGHRSATVCQRRSRPACVAVPVCCTAEEVATIRLAAGILSGECAVLPHVQVGARWSPNGPHGPRLHLRSESTGWVPASAPLASTAIV